MGSDRQPAAGRDDVLSGRFLVIEGLDGAGTTTQTGLLTDALRSREVRVCATAEPSEGPIGQALRAHVRGEISLDGPTAALTFTADRADHLGRVIRPALAAGECVVCDRYLLSTLAYQGCEGVDREWILHMSQGFEVPDLTVYLDVPDVELARRLSGRGRSERYEDEGMTEGLRTSYGASIALLRERGHEIVVVDGSLDPSALLEEILRRLDGLG